MINKLVLDALKPLAVPVSFQKYSGKADKYITFHEYFSSGEDFDDDNEAFTSHYIQVDIWSKNDYTETVSQVKQLLHAKGFKRLDEVDLYEEDTGIYHKGLKFYYLEEREA